MSCRNFSNQPGGKSAEHPYVKLMKQDMGRLSVLCGAGTAAAAAGCGIVLLRGGRLKEIQGTVQNMIGDIAGMVCDGAKPGCALKIATAVEAGIRAALLALGGSIITGQQGIIEHDVEKSIQNLSRLGTSGMAPADEEILRIMTERTDMVRTD